MKRKQQQMIKNQLPSERFRSPLLIIFSPNYFLDPVEVVRDPSVDPRRIFNGAHTSEAGNAYDLIKTFVTRMEYLQRASRVSLARVFLPVTAHVSGAQHARNDPPRYSYGGIKLKGAVQVVDNVETRLQQPITLPFTWEQKLIVNYFWK